MEHEKITIIIPNYNYGKYLLECIDSCVNQSIPACQILLLDDKSNDIYTLKTLEYIKKFYNKNVTVISKKHEGLAATRNFGINIAEGDFIIFLDSDDKLDYRFTEYTLNVLKNNKKTAYCYTWRQAFDEDTFILKTKQIDPFSLLIHNESNMTALIRKNVFKTAQFDPSIRYHEDWDFWLTLLEQGYIGTCLPQPLFYYRIHHDSMLSKQMKNPSHIYESFRELTDKHANLYANNLPNILARILLLELELKNNYSLSNLSISERIKLKIFKYLHKKSSTYTILL